MRVEERLFLPHTGIGGPVEVSGREWHACRGQGRDQLGVAEMGCIGGVGNRAGAVGGLGEEEEGTDMH